MLSNQPVELPFRYGTLTLAVNVSTPNKAKTDALQDILSEEATNLANAELKHLRALVNALLPDGDDGRSTATKMYSLDLDDSEFSITLSLIVNIDLEAEALLASSAAAIVPPLFKAASDAMTRQIERRSMSELGYDVKITDFAVETIAEALFSHS
jgi:hypothetical protein